MNLYILVCRTRNNSENILSTDCVLELPRGELVLEQVVAGDYAHRNQVQQALCAPDLDVELWEVARPEDSPAEDESQQEQSAWEQDYCSWCDYHFV